MSSKGIIYRTLLWTFGILFFCWALFSAFRVATMRVEQSADKYLYLIQADPWMAYYLILRGGSLWYTAISILLFGIGMQRVRVLYWCIQATIWLIGISLWYQTSLILDPFPENPFWIIVTFICSIVLLVLYRPIVSILMKCLNLLYRKERMKEGTKEKNPQMYRRHSHKEKLKVENPEMYQSSSHTYPEL